MMSAGRCVSQLVWSKGKNRRSQWSQECEKQQLRGHILMELIVLRERNENSAIRCAYLEVKKVTRGCRKNGKA